MTTLQPYLSFPGTAEEGLLMASDALASLGQELVQGKQRPQLGASDEPWGGRPDLHRAVRGAEVEMPIADQAWGDYHGSLQDKFGVMWMVNYGQPQHA